jgi:hypothetical protein
MWVGLALIGIAGAAERWLHRKTGAADADVRATRH